MVGGDPLFIIQSAHYTVSIVHSKLRVTYHVALSVSTLMDS